MRHSSTVVTLALAILLGAARAHAQTSSPNAGAVAAIHSAPLRVPVLVVPQPDSGSLVIFSDYRDGTTDVYAQRLDRHGRALLGESGALVWDLLPNEYLDAFMADGSGGCILALSRSNGATGRDLILKRVAGDGSLPYGANGITICNASRDQTRPVMAPGPAGSYYVAWADDRSGSGSYYWDVYAQRVSVAGAALWAANGIKVNATGYRVASGNGIPGYCGDGSGGLLLQWWSEATPTSRAQRISSAGALQWGASGVPVGVSNRGLRKIIADGSGGFWGEHSDWDGTNNSFYIHRVLSTGALAFPAAGLAYHSPFNGSMQTTLTRTPGGACLVWSRQSYYSGGYSALVLQEVSGAGAMLRGADGEVLSDAPLGLTVAESNGNVLVQYFDLPMGQARGRARLQRYSLDGTPQFPGGGVFLGRQEAISQAGVASLAASSTGLIHAAWADMRYLAPNSPVNYQAFAQAFTAGGTPLYVDPEVPVLRSARDAAQDQGGYVRVAWDASLADHPGAQTAQGYRVWRALPAEASATLARSRPEGDGMFRVGERTLMVQAGLYWEMAGQQPAATLPQYALTVPTMQDSVAGDPATQSFMVEAYDDSSHHWFSNVLTARSVDNLAPAAVTSAMGFYANGTTSLYWSGVADADLCCYDVFRGESPGFVPGPANRVATTSQLTTADAHGAPAYYRIAARDVHGNLGPSALVVPQGTLAAGDEDPREWRLRSTWSAADGAIELELDLPQADEGQLELFDVSGRRLWSRDYRASSARGLTFRVDSGHGLAPGLVLARARSASGRHLTTRTIVMR